MNSRVLADALTIFLTPAMPYLVSREERRIQETRGKLGEKAVELVDKLWAKLRPKMEEKPAAVEAVQEVARGPEDADAQAFLCLQLWKILDADSSLAAEIAQLLEASDSFKPSALMHSSGAIGQGQGNVVAGAGGIAVGRDIIRVSKSKED